MQVDSCNSDCGVSAVLAPPQAPMMPALSTSTIPKASPVHGLIKSSSIPVDSAVISGSSGAQSKQIDQKKSVISTQPVKS